MGKPAGRREGAKHALVRKTPRDRVCHLGRPAVRRERAATDRAGGQFWIEKERLIFLRLVQKTKAGDLSDIRFTKCEPLDRGWIGTVVVFQTNGKETFRESYRDWRINPAVTDTLFVTDTWAPPVWAK